MKPSDASSSSTSKPPENPTLFLDEGLGQYVIAGALRATGARVEIHAGHYHAGERDEVWLPEVARRGWLVLKRSENLTGAEMGAIFVKALSAIYRPASRELPFIAKVSKDGRVELWWPERPTRPRMKQRLTR